MSARNKFSKDKKKIVLCQAIVRGAVQKRKYLRILKATKILQTYVRATMSSRLISANYLNKRQSSIKIQSWWRMVRTRNTFRATIRCVIKCQTSVRSYLARRETAIRRRQLQRQTAAISIQRHTRGWLARGRYRQLTYSVVIIQRWTRGIFKMRRLVQNYHQQKMAVTKISSFWKGYSARKQYLLMKRSTVKIKAWYRARVMRRKYLAMLTAARVIQSVWRANQIRVLCRQDFLDKKNAALVIQKFWRMKRDQKVFEQKRKAVVVIQKYTRGFISRRFTLRKKNALVTLQRAVRGLRETKKEQQKFRSIKAMIIRLQTVARVKLAKEKFNRLKLDVAYREQLRQELRILEAVTTFQRVWRGRCARELLKASWTARRAEELKRLEETRERLQAATAVAVANPGECLGARTASAIDYLFSVRDMAELLARVKVIEVSTRLSEECCQQMAVAGNKPMEQISAPHGGCFCNP